MFHVDFSPMIDHVWEKCPDNTNAVQWKDSDAKDNVPVPIPQGLINNYKLDKLYCAIVKHIVAEKECNNHTQVGVVNPEQKYLKLDVSSDVAEWTRYKYSSRTSWQIQKHMK